MNALVTGGTGFVGHRLISHLDNPVVLSRRPEAAGADLGVAAFGWTPTEDWPPATAFDGVDTVFHLAGEPVGAGRWTTAKMERIRESRVVGTRNLVHRIEHLERRPTTLVSASAVGYYGSRGDEVLDESALGAESFLGNVCRDWEDEARRAEDLGVRVVMVRIGIVLGRDGGALASMLPLFRLGLGGRLGNGHQWMPWIHLDDLVGLMLHAATAPEIRGPVNGVSPNPVTNREFTRVLASQLGRPALFPAPSFALRLALGKFATVLLASQRAVPQVAGSTGFSFRHPDLEGALEQILGETDNRSLGNDPRARAA